MEVKVSYNGGDKWRSKVNGVIYVEKEEHIDLLYNLLLEQDEYWERHKDVIKKWTPLKTWSQVIFDCEYVGKTDIYNVEKIRSQIPFVFFQHENEQIIQSTH